MLFAMRCPFQIILLFGQHGRDYLPLCLKDMIAAGEQYGAQWYCAGAVSKKGHPHHPLYLRKDEKIKPFDVKAYLHCLGE